jgi:hypothetical protein
VAETLRASPPSYRRHRTKGIIHIHLITVYLDWTIIRSCVCLKCVQLFSNQSKKCLLFFTARPGRDLKARAFYNRPPWAKHLVVRRSVCYYTVLEARLTEFGYTHRPTCKVLAYQAEKILLCFVPSFLADQSWEARILLPGLRISSPEDILRIRNPGR